VSSLVLDCTVESSDVELEVDESEVDELEVDESEAVESELVDVVSLVDEEVVIVALVAAITIPTPRRLPAATMVVATVALRRPFFLASTLLLASISSTSLFATFLFGTCVAAF
jgi:hypothetical protein